ncbi:helix-turn-helix transcriptional regulator [Novosphingobium fluoreni]|uniref:helix-turn-helix transcriptional regulator n=1 Tax=Novosphingobium fluoreni TaxID=1391222 RepID=UPI003CCCE0EC
MVDGKRLRDFGDMSHEDVLVRDRVREPGRECHVGPDDVNYQASFLSDALEDDAIPMEQQPTRPSPMMSFSEPDLSPKSRYSRPYKPGDRLLTSKEVCELLNVSLSTLHRLRKSTDFPDPVEFNSRNKRWLYDAVMRWIRHNRDKLVSLVAKP